MNSIKTWLRRHRVGIAITLIICVGATLAQWPLHLYDQIGRPPQPTAPSTAQIETAQTAQPGKTFAAHKPAYVIVNVINGVGSTGSVQIFAQCAVGNACGNAYYEQIKSAPGFIVSGTKVIYAIMLDTKPTLDKSDPQIIWVALPSTWQDFTKLSKAQKAQLPKAMNAAVTALNKVPQTTNTSQPVNLPYLGVVTAGNTDQNYLIGQIGKQ